MYRGIAVSTITSGTQTNKYTTTSGRTVASAIANLALAATYSNIALAEPAQDLLTKVFDKERKDKLSSMGKSSYGPQKLKRKK